MPLPRSKTTTITKPGLASIVQRVITRYRRQEWGRLGVEVEAGLVTEDRSCRYLAPESAQVKALSTKFARLLDKYGHFPA